MAFRDSVFRRHFTKCRRSLPGGSDGYRCVETLIQQKLNPGLCSVHPDKPLVYGEKVFLVPRGDVTFPAICQSVFASLESERRLSSRDRQMAEVSATVHSLIFLEQGAATVGINEMLACLAPLRSSS